MATIYLEHACGRYPIMVGYRILNRLSGFLAKDRRGGRVFVIYDAQVFALHGSMIAQTLADAEAEVVEITIPAGERSKSAATVARLHDFLLVQRASRDDLILAVGGGVISDLAGYVAATTLRGIGWGVISTSLLGMVDAGIGGKTGINHRYGKNLIGAFWQPRVVLCDTCFLHTLSRNDMLSGLGEVAKYAGLIGEDMPSQLADYLSGDLYHRRRLVEMVARSAAYKAEIVGRDEREGNLRMVLNLGHSFAHGIESSAGYGRISHGQAVLAGLLAALELSRLVYPSSRRSLTEYENVLTSLAARFKWPRLTVDTIIDAMRWDKKRKGRQLRFVLLKRPGNPVVTTEVPRRSVTVALRWALGRVQEVGER
ncbi:MAG: 3-dehydroquinate synthase [bacterium]